MKFSLSCSFLFALIVSVPALGQISGDTSVRPSRVIVTDSTPAPKRIVAPTPVARLDTAQESEVSGPSDDRLEPEKAPSSTRNAPLNSSSRVLSFGQIKSRIAEAKRNMLARPMQIASVEPVVPTSIVRVAFFDWKTQQVDYVVMPKETFLSKTGVSTALTSTGGRSLLVTTIRANGVNTPIRLVDSSGQAQLPLMVQYPVEKGGRHVETAYYMSTHPGIVTPEVVNAGKFYVRNVIEIARQKLREKGVIIQPKVVDMAERLATVEHVDHDRFRNEPHINIYNDIFTLYALNEGQTYRYSVSSAGAGGMVQMIPSTYRMVRSWHPNVYLKPDFVEGMRDHVNASQAMLIYMQRTWNDLVSSPTVSNALATGIATPQQLMAAGYNSNPARLAGYISRGGANWTNLIPRETRIYLQIYDSLERYVPMTPRTK
jgi:hypothetical protein